MILKKISLRQIENVFIRRSKLIYLFILSIVDVEYNFLREKKTYCQFFENINLQSLTQYVEQNEEINQNGTGIRNISYLIFQTFVKVLFLDERLDTNLCLSQRFKFSQRFLIL